MKTTALIVVAGIAAVASAGDMNIYWTVGDTGNNDGVIDAGESAVLNMYAEMVPGATGFAGSIYNIGGDAEWAAGNLDSYNNLLDALTNDGTAGANNSVNSIESFQLPPLFNPNFDASNPVHLYSMQWTPNSYAGQTVTGGSNGHLNFDVYTDTFGTSVGYTGNVTGFRFTVAPAPASMALLGLGGLVAGRRRR
ncbi:MAG: PEP-CTERM sorting domain-containing protein [Phycisphaerales bacterium]|nr:PEP-CTERM sorting domain-containing protein [Phycisphaerales bacterium]